jgi:hypothetical protein
MQQLPSGKSAASWILCKSELSYMANSVCTQGIPIEIQTPKTLEPNGPQHTLSLSSPSSTLLPPLSHCTFIQRYWERDAFKKRSSILYSIFKFLTSVNLEIVQAGKCLYSIHTQISTLFQKTAHIIKTFSSWSCRLKIDKEKDST